MTRIKRSLVAHFLNTGTVLSPVWSLIGEGVTSHEMAYNPESSKETFIHLDQASARVEGYAPTAPVEMTAYNGDAVFEYIDGLRRGHSILGDAEGEVVNVWMYEGAALTYYYAEKQAVAIQVDSFGGDGGKAAKIKYTLSYSGNVARGSFSPTALAFVTAPVNTTLTTMVIGSVTLAPLFATDKSWLWYAGSVSNATTSVTMTSTLSGATITQRVGASTVSQGGAAALSVGVNHLTIEVTVGSETVTYHIDITRAAS